MYNNLSLLIIIMLMSLIIGIMIQRLIFQDIEFSLLSTNNSNIFLLLFVIINNNFFLILCVLSLYISNCLHRYNILILIHFILIILNIYICTNNSLVHIILLMISLDVISLINILLVKDSLGEGIWFYFLYQTIITIFIYYFLIIDLLSVLGLLYYYKLGSGIGGYYIPSFYYYVLTNNPSLLIYLGLTNIILMYNPIFLLSSYSSSSLSSFILMINMLIVVYLINLYISNGSLFVNTWLYCISLSTIVLSNVYNILIYVDLVIYSLYYFLYYFHLSCPVKVKKIDHMILFLLL